MLQRAVLELPDALDVLVDDVDGGARAPGFYRSGGQRQIGLEGEAEVVDLAQQRVQGTHPRDGGQDRGGRLLVARAGQVHRLKRTHGAQPTALLALVHLDHLLVRSAWHVWIRHTRAMSCPLGIVFHTSCQTPAVSPSATASATVLAVLGGTGEQGRGLARRFALAGHPVVLGSRSAERAEQAAADLPDGVTGAGNADAAAKAEIVIVAVPWEGHRELLVELAPQLAGKVVIDCVNPLGFDKQGAFALPVDEGSAAQQAAAVLPDSRVVAAFHHVSAVLLLDEAVDRGRHGCARPR